MDQWPAVQPAAEGNDLLKNPEYRMQPHKLLHSVALLLAISVPWQAPVNAAGLDLVGDTLTYLRAYPSPVTPYTTWDPASVSGTVAVGTSDQITWDVNRFQTVIDAEADTIDFRFPLVSSFTDIAGNFDGFVISGFSNDIASVSVVDNDSGLAIALTHTAREVWIDLEGPNAGGTTGFLLGVQLAPIPEPSQALLSILGLGLIGLRIAKRRG